MTATAIEATRRALMDSAILLPVAVPVVGLDGLDVGAGLRPLLDHRRPRIVGELHQVQVWSQRLEGFDVEAAVEVPDRALAGLRGEGDEIFAGRSGLLGFGTCR